MVDLDNIDPYLLRPVGFVRSKLKRREDCPKQGYEGAPDAWVEIEPAFAEGLDGITPGCEVVLITWFHKATRNVLKLHPRNDPQNPLQGVFTTRSSDRPNPVGLHRVEVLQVDVQGKFRVRPLEALDGTPIIDIKPILQKSLDA
ncbi:MAG: tRNA (N6-threonylcarbamoyladenosine(37)-N6)-methyltransferase TrmO [Desulfobacterales bacterium]|jgi:tRNA-Thr(GGU) m(6)t(6)A37 methyltransferase TsaA|nr:tRNA (N6-threonylcarbamoyladenosine(37)-N6)-methyltransferase TrmO [Desulfobacterales bacterium]